MHSANFGRVDMHFNPHGLCGQQFTIEIVTNMIANRGELFDGSVVRYREDIELKTHRYTPAFSLCINYHIGLRI